MKRKTLQQLVEQARRVRDTAAVSVAGATRDETQAQRTLDTLSSYLVEHLKAGERPSFDPAILRLRERFTRRLDVAIDEQTRARDALQEATERRREELLERQRRLLAFRTLESRRESALARHRERADQRQTDEIAAQTRWRQTRGFDHDD